MENFALPVTQERGQTLFAVAYGITKRKNRWLMNSVHDQLREHMLARLGVLPLTISMPSLPALLASEWSPEFEEYCRNRMVVGAFRYGLLGKDKPSWARIDSCMDRLLLYLETGNTEHLVDVANLCQLEFVEGQHPAKHFAAHDDGVHVEARG
jgi:hypothetical protein